MLCGMIDFRMPKGIYPRRPGQYDNRERMSLIERLMGRFMAVTETGCWIWLGALDWYGYGKVSFKSRNLLAHRAMYEQTMGRVPPGMELDHTCRVRCCVNPRHMEPVTHAENIRRGNGGSNQWLKLCCPKGHPYSGTTKLPGGKVARICRVCISQRAKQKEHQ